MKKIKSFLKSLSSLRKSKNSKINSHTNRRAHSHSHSHSPKLKRQNTDEDLWDNFHFVNVDALQEANHKHLKYVKGGFKKKKSRSTKFTMKKHRSTMKKRRSTMKKRRSTLKNA